MNRYSEAPAMRWAETTEGFCPLCRGQMMKVQIAFFDGREESALDPFLKDGWLPYCSICGATQYLKGKKVKVVEAADTSTPKKAIGKTGTITSVGYGEAGDRFPDSPHVLVYIEAEDGHSGETIEFFPEELRLENA